MTDNERFPTSSPAKLQGPGEGALSESEMFGRYELLELVGRGGMGEVHRARDPKHSRIVALKRLLPALSDNQDLTKRFMLECRAAASLNDPHVIPIHDSGEIDGQLYIDMRYIEGTDLERTIERDGPVAPKRTASVIHQAAEALDAAHAENLIHRDVKPSNLLIARHEFVYLIDFGIVHVLGAPTTINPRTEVGTVIGTWHYMAPERFTDPDRTDPRVDVYSLACVLYECLTGQRPFPLSDRFAVARAHLELPPPLVSDLYPELAAFDRIVARGMAKDPDERYRSAGDLATECDTVAATLGRPIPGRSMIGAPGTVRHPSPRPQPQPQPTAAPQPGAAPTAVPPAPAAPYTRGPIQPLPRASTRQGPTPLPSASTRQGPTPLPRLDPPVHPNGTRPDPPPPTRLSPTGVQPSDGSDRIGSPDLPPQGKRVGVLVTAGIVLVVVMVVLGEVLGRDDSTAESGGDGPIPPDSPASVTTSVAALPASAAAPPEGDLGIAGVPISVLPCDGRWITNIGSAYSADQASNKQQVTDLLIRHPGSAYLLADAGCHSQLPGGSHERNYRVFFGPFDFEPEACAAKPASVPDSWVKPLDDTTDPEMEFCLSPQHSR